MQTDQIRTDRKIPTKAETDRIHKDRKIPTKVKGRNRQRYCVMDNRKDRELFIGKQDSN
jgi:hypothetical protein